MQTVVSALQGVLCENPVWTVCCLKVIMRKKDSLLAVQMSYKYCLSFLVQRKKISAVNLIFSYFVEMKWGLCLSGSLMLYCLVSYCVPLLVGDAWQYVVMPIRQSAESWYQGK